MLKYKFLKKLTSKYTLIFPVLAFLYLTTFQIPFFDAINLVQATDVYSYLIISKSAPFFPEEFIAFHFSQRWIPHYLVGVISKQFYIDLSISYVIINALIIFNILILFYKIILRVSNNAHLRTLIFLFLALSVYTFRLYLFVPGLLADLVFVLGLSLTIIGCLEGRYRTILFGLVIAATGKQFVLLVLPGISLYFYSIWVKKKSRLITLFLVSLLNLITIIFCMLLKYSSAGFALPNSITFNVLFNIFPWLISDHYSFFILLEHIFRIALPLLPFIFMIVMNPNKWVDKLTILRTPESCGLILMILAPMAFAFLPGPEYQMGNQGRYIGLILLPMAIVTLKTFSKIKFQLNFLDFFWLLSILLCLTFHHRYTIIQSEPINFFIFQIIGLLELLTWFILRKKALLIDRKNVFDLNDNPHQ